MNSGENSNNQQPKQKKRRVLASWNDIKNVKKNWQIVRSSPYASLKFALTLRKLIVAFLIVYILFIGYNMVVNYSATGYMGILGRLISGGIILYICYRLYMSIKLAEKQLEFYKKNPKHINRKELNTKKEIDDILNMFEKPSAERRSNDI